MNFFINDIVTWKLNPKADLLVKGFKSSLNGSTKYLCVRRDRNNEVFGWLPQSELILNN